MHTNFKGSDWKFSRAKNDDVRQRLNYDKMVENKVFRISKDIDISDQTHSLELFVSAGYHYDEYDAVGDELWLVEMVVMVSNGMIIIHIMYVKNNGLSSKYGCDTITFLLLRLEMMTITRSTVFFLVLSLQEHSRSIVKSRLNLRLIHTINAYLWRRVCTNILKLN